MAANPFAGAAESNTRDGEWLGEGTVLVRITSHSFGESKKEAGYIAKVTCSVLKQEHIVERDGVPKTNREGAVVNCLWKLAGNAKKDSPKQAEIKGYVGALLGLEPAVLSSPAISDLMLETLETDLAKVLTEPGASATLIVTGRRWVGDAGQERINPSFIRDDARVAKILADDFVPSKASY